MLFNQLSGSKISLAFRSDFFFHCIQIFPTRTPTSLEFIKWAFPFEIPSTIDKYLCVGRNTVFSMMKCVKAKGKYNKQIIRTLNMCHCEVRLTKHEISI